ncbi:MAG TPA: heavy metal-associated domain-containing protein [Geminicoccaceae bacterium]|jgi:copper chaperone CopZ|nr:heavy metal-associated domain-containing protein [Geminicoccaceae bacterium]
MKSVTLAIEGMHCEGCAQTIEALIGAEPGVRAADVSYEERQARILYDPQTVGEDELVKVIEKGGYRVPARKP